MRAMPDHDVAVVIVNYNSAALTLSATGSIFDRTADMSGVHIHIVDNASPDGDAIALRAAITARGWQGAVSLYEEARNHGFGRGNNVALKAIAAMERPPKNVLCLNPDTRLMNDVLAQLGDCLDRHPEAAIAGGAMQDEDGAIAVAAFRFPNLAGIFGDAVNFGPLSRRFARWRAPIQPVPQEETEVDWVTGAVFMARLEAIESVGFFDPNYFLYFEEVDMMKAVRARGWRIIHAPDAMVEHIGGAITEQRAKRTRRPAYWYDSWTWYFLSNHGRIYTAAASLLWLAGAALDGVISTIRRCAPNYPVRFFRDFIAISMRRQLGGRPGDPRSTPEEGA